MMWTAVCSFWSPLLFTLAFGEQQRSSSRPVFACGGNFTGHSGTIGSQGHPGVYPPNTKCVWRIIVPQGRVVSLSFRIMDLESDGVCRYDYVDVYDGHVSGQRLGRFCGTFRPGALVTSSNKMQVVMVSDANTAGSGFLAVYAAVWPNEGGDRYCGGLLDKPGSLKTPNWPDRDYPAGVTCSWQIVAPQDQIIELKFEKFDVERDNHCRYDHVAVYNGREPSETQRIGRFCGDSPPPLIYSNGSRLFIQFVSDLSLTADGFIGRYLFKPKNSTFTGLALTTAPNAPTTACLALTYSEALCQQKCKRTGTIESHYCSSDFVITGTLISAAMWEQSVLATFSISNVYKEGNLAIQQAGKAMSTKITVLCKKCPLVRRGWSVPCTEKSLVNIRVPRNLGGCMLDVWEGLNYIVMGHINREGQGIVSPHNFVVAFKTKKQRDLNVLTNVQC